MRWSGFAEFAFPGSAHLAFARAAELAETDAHEMYPEAWVIEDRRITFSLETETSRLFVERIKRFLDLLALQAIEGDAVIAVSFPPERWERRPSIPPYSAEFPLLDAAQEYPSVSQTIRTAS